MMGNQMGASAVKTSMEKKMTKTRWMGAALAALLVFTGAAGVPAAERLRENFEAVGPAGAGGVVPAREGAGWRQPDVGVQYSRSGSLAGVQRGMISFDLQRNPGEFYNGNPIIFEFTWADGSRLLALRVAWNSAFDPARPMFFLNGTPSPQKESYGTHGVGLWPIRILGDRGVAEGEWIHVDLVWDDPAGRYEFYVDGRALDTTPGSYRLQEFVETEKGLKKLNPPKLIRVPDWREGAKGFSSRPFSFFLARAENIHLGHRPQGAQPDNLMDAAVIDNFVIVTGEDVFAADPASQSVAGLAGSSGNAGITLTWDPPQTHGINQGFHVYRRSAGSTEPPARLTAIPLRDLRYLDTAVTMGEAYEYAVAPFAGSMAGAVSAPVTVTAVPDTGPPAQIASLGHTAARVAGFSGALVAGDTVTVTMEGTAGLEAVYDVLTVADKFGAIPLAWKGWGVYLEDKAFFDQGEVNLRDVEEYRVYVSRKFVPLAQITVDTPFVEALEVEVQEYLLDRLDADTPYYVAVLALMKDGSFIPVLKPSHNLPMTEAAETPGAYEGSFKVPYGLRIDRMLIAGRLGTGVVEAVLVGDEEFAVDSRLIVEVAPSTAELKADEQSTAEVIVTVTDANGDAVRDHEIKFLLATTSQYTGVVGGGAFAEQVGGTIETKRNFRATTDLFGRVKATYTAGFAAKTAVIVARDMVSQDTGAGYITTHIEATADIILEQELTAARSKALAGYKMTVTSSDEWLTADGESEARITAMVTLQGNPVEGHRVGFAVTSGTGTIRTASGTTDRRGKARAVYTAGTKIGMVVIQAIDHTIGLSGTVEIELRSDAPAKIAITVTPEVLFADGRSTADVEVTVTDINDNPNEGTIVEYAVVIGSGELRRIDDLTDRNGVSTAEYVAGKIPGRVSIGVTVRSVAPTEQELMDARELAVAVLDYDFY